MTGAPSLQPATAAAPSPGAVRMARYRRRRRNGLRCLLVELRKAEIEVLIRRGYLDAAHRRGKNAVLKALYDFLDDTLR
jgi:hypothetical protein